MSLTSKARRPLAGIPRPLIVGLGVLALVVAAFVAFQMRPKAPKEPYRFAAVERGDITRSVSASGSLQALVRVDVGSQISGLVSEVRADFNDEVRRGQVLAVIDPQTFQSRVAQAQADVEAGVAALRQAEAQLANAQADYDRKKELVEKGYYAPAVLDQSTAAFRNAQAAVNAASARVNQSRAQLRTQQVDLARTTIVSPIDGVVVDRKVEPGQTVAASFQAPVLFTIAQDLSKLEVKISVDEADVGQVQEGQTVRFTVDAFPEDSFQGVVTQVRKQPVSEQTVVAYTVIAEADNPQRKLLPGMTANADIVLETRRDVLKVPASALRWAPPAANGAARPGGPGGSVVVAGPGFGPAGGRAAGQGGGRGAMMGARLVEQLELDVKQQKAWEPIQADLRQKSMAAFASAGGDRAAVQQAMRKNMEEALAKLEPVLRPDQKTKLAALRETMLQGGGRGTGATRAGVVHVLRDGKPTPVPVRVGATDGSSTQIMGDLKPGDQVIVGGGPRPKAQAPTPFGGGGGPGGGARVRM